MAERQRKVEEIEIAKRAELIRKRAQESITNMNNIKAAVQAIKASRYLLELEHQEFRTEMEDTVDDAGSAANIAGKTAKALTKLFTMMETGLAVVEQLSSIGVYHSGTRGNMIRGSNIDRGVMSETSKSLMCACRNTNAGTIEWIKRAMARMKGIILEDVKQDEVTEDGGARVKRKRL